MEKNQFSRKFVGKFICKWVFKINPRSNIGDISEIVGIIFRQVFKGISRKNF